ncbi:DUF6503 family protein [uncultured Maribacter sp.]|uniref:DUF6503 family protein n=1 Tax=uncultured Maribacter sp. TaxID=431308 RepID=UPI002604576C|nr:DUF6503 family protein [uncultured Maribacter sp.]
MPTAQAVIDKSIEVSGTNFFTNQEVSFTFRDKEYTSIPMEQGFKLQRKFIKDSVEIKEIKHKNTLSHFENNVLVKLSDSLISLHANSINSVHYFSRLPYGLNDSAVQKKMLGIVFFNNEEYYKIQITFSKEGGGDDFDDVYIYWFNVQTYLPDFLAYSFTVNGGGNRFRIAYNERYVNGIRFVDYKNYKTIDNKYPIQDIDKLYNTKELEFLSKIELKDIKVPN